MSDLTLEIVEGPGAGRQVPLDRPIVIGRDPAADVVLGDGQVSRKHARVSPATDGSAVVEDLESANGTFVNHNELFGPARLDAGDELLIGVTVMELRSRAQIVAAPSAVRVVPPGLVRAPREPSYVDPDVVDPNQPVAPEKQSYPELEKFLDVRVRRQAQLAPLALLVLITLALILYFATQ